MRLWREGGVWRVRVQRAKHHSTFYTPSLVAAIKYGRAR